MTLKHSDTEVSIKVETGVRENCRARNYSFLVLPQGAIKMPGKVAFRRRSRHLTAWASVWLGS